MSKIIRWKKEACKGMSTSSTPKKRSHTMYNDEKDGSTPSPTPKKQRTTQQLQWMIHSQGCKKPAGSCTNSCARVKKQLKHRRECKDSSCSKCAVLRTLVRCLTHCYKSPQGNGCAICGPVLSALPKPATD